MDTAGTPVDNQIAIFADANTIEGDANLTWDGTNLDLTDAKKIRVGTGHDGEIYVDANDDVYIANVTADKDIYIQVLDSAVTKTPIFVQGSTGNVGIGTTGPGYKLEVVGNSDTNWEIAARDFGTNSQAKLVLQTYNDQTTDYNSWFNFAKSHSDTLGAMVATLDTEDLGAFEFRGTANDGIFRRGAYIKATQDGAAGASSVPAKFSFITTDTSGVEQYALTIKPGGKVGIGTTGPSSILEVNKASGSAYITTVGSSGNNAGIDLKDSDSDGFRLAYIGSTDLFAITEQTSGKGMWMNTSGNVGIGTVPMSESKLHLHDNASAASIIWFSNDTTGVTTGDGASIGLDSAEGLQIYSRESGKYISFFTSAGQAMHIQNNGNVGIGTTVPTNLLSLGGESARIFWMERELTADTAGNTLTITAGGATSGATDKAGGALILQGGLSTGSAESGVTIQGCVAGAAGTADRTQTTAIQVLGNKIGFWAQTPAVRAAAYTITNVTADRAYDANATTIDEISDVLGTLIADLITYGLLTA